MSATSEGFDLDNLDSASADEINANLIHVWSWRGPMYEMAANSLMSDYAADFAKLHRWGSDFFGRPDPVNLLLMAMQNLFSYVYLGWETGIFNQFNTLRRNGLSKQQCMEIVLFANLYAGMRGLGHTFRAVGDVLPAFAAPTVEPAFPENWTVDPVAFRAGLDLSTREVTDADRANLESWYEANVGYVPASIRFGLTHHPEFVKMNRAKWECAIKTLPKQVAPHLMVRQNMLTGNIDGLRESLCLARTWGISAQHVINTLHNTAMYFTGFEGLYAAYDAAEKLLADW